jgi:uncharacterized protein YjbI with pentapeptide repeats
MKNLLLGIIAILFSFNGWAYNETDLAKFKALNACEGCDLSGIKLDRGERWIGGEIELRNAKLNNANLKGVDLRNTKLNYAKLRNADLSGAVLIGADLEHAVLSNANLTGANLTGANIGCRFSLNCAYLMNANLSGANLSNTNFENAALDGANLSGANLRNANLDGANLSGADLSGVDLTTANLTGVELEGAIFCKTKMPWGVVNDDCSNQYTEESSRVTYDPSSTLKKSQKTIQTKSDRFDWDEKNNTWWCKEIKSGQVWSDLNCNGIPQDDDRWPNN